MRKMFLFVMLFSGIINVYSNDTSKVLNKFHNVTYPFVINQVSAFELIKKVNRLSMSELFDFKNWFKSHDFIVNDTVNISVHPVAKGVANGLEFFFVGIYDNVENSVLYNCFVREQNNATKTTSILVALFGDTVFNNFQRASIFYENGMLMFSDTEHGSFERDLSYIKLHTPIDTSVNVFGLLPFENKDSLLIDRIDPRNMKKGFMDNYTLKFDTSFFESIRLFPPADIIFKNYKFDKSLSSFSGCSDKGYKTYIVDFFKYSNKQAIVYLNEFSYEKYNRFYEINIDFLTFGEKNVRRIQVGHFIAIDKKIISIKEGAIRFNVDDVNIDGTGSGR